MSRMNVKKTHTHTHICIKIPTLVSRIHAIFRSSSEKTFVPETVPFGFIVFSPCSIEMFILTVSSLTRLKTEYSQNSRSYGAPSLAACTPLPSVLMSLALVPVSRTHLGAFWTGGTSRTRCLRMVTLRSSMFKTSNCKSTKNSLLSSSKPLPETFDRSTRVMESVCARRVLYGKRWCCARDWWIMAVITGDTWNLVILLFLRTPHHGHTLVTDNHINTHTEQQTKKTTELVGSTKEPRRGFPNTSPDKQTS